MGALLGGSSLLLGALPAKQELKKRANNGPFAINPRLLGQPGLDGASAVFSFPLFQTFVIAAFRFDSLTGVRVLVDFHLAGPARARFWRGGRSASTRLWIKQVDHVLQAITIFRKQITQLGFKFNFFLQASIALEGLECLQLLGKVFFKLAEFCEFRHWKPLLDVLVRYTKKATCMS